MLCAISAVKSSSVRMLTVFVILLVPFLCLLSMAALQAFCTFRDARKLSAPGTFGTTTSTKIHVYKTGSGSPPIVLEAGISATSLSWSLLQPRLAALTTTYSYDRAGLGWSGDCGGKRSLRAIVADLDAWVTALRVQTPFILMVHSFGAYIARYYASIFPEKLAGIVFVDPLTPEEWRQPTADQLRTLRRGALYSRIGGVLSAIGVVRFSLWMMQRGNLNTPGKILRIFGAAADSTVRRVLGEISKFPPEAVPFIRAHWSAGRSFWTMARYLNSLPACAEELWNCSPLPASLPITVVSGSHQPPERLDEHAALANGSYQGRHIIATHSGHWVHLDEPDLLVDAANKMMHQLSSNQVSSKKS